MKGIILPGGAGTRLYPLTIRRYLDHQDRMEKEPAAFTSPITNRCTGTGDKKGYLSAFSLRRIC